MGQNPSFPLRTPRAAFHTKKNRNRANAVPARGAARREYENSAIRGVGGGRFSRWTGLYDNSQAARKPVRRIK